MRTPPKNARRPGSAGLRSRCVCVVALGFAACTSESRDLAMASSALDPADAGSDGSADAGLPSYLVGCDSMFAARVLEKQIEADATFPEDCNVALSTDVGVLGSAGNALCLAGETANECRTRLYETPPDDGELDPGCWNASAPRSCMRSKWLPRCTDGTDTGCTEPEVVCQDGTRPMIYAERTRSGSNDWIFFMGGEGGPCAGDSCWFLYRHARLIGKPVFERAMSTLHPDYETIASQVGHGIESGLPAGGANPMADYTRVGFDRCADSASDAEEIVTFGDGVAPEIAAELSTVPLPAPTRASTTRVWHRGLNIWKAAFASLATPAGRDLDGDGTPDVPSLADATTIVLSGSSDASMWLVFAADLLAEAIHEIAPGAVVRVILDGYYEPGLDGEARFATSPPTDLDVFSHPYTATGLCALPDNSDGVVNEACSDASYEPGPTPSGPRNHRDRLDARGIVLDRSCEAFHGVGAAPCYDKIHTIMHHLGTPFAVVADQEDHTIAGSTVHYADDPSYRWANAATYRMRVLAQTYDAERFWTTGREDGPADARDAMFILRKSRRGSAPWGAAEHTHLGSNSRMNAQMTFCSAVGAPVGSASLARMLDTWIEGAAPETFVVENGITWDGVSPYWITGSTCTAPE
jgi:hypothetical protein